MHTAAWINAHTDKNDFVVAFWDWGWMLKCRWTGMLQCAMWEHSEFLFPAEVRDARYVVVSAMDLPLQRLSFSGNSGAMVGESSSLLNLS